MAEEAVQSQAVHAAALKYLQQRGYRSGQQLLAGDASAKPAEMKLNELVICDAQRRVLSCALHLPLEDSTSHEESYVELCGWIRARPLDQRRELLPICYPLYVHCFIALVEKQQDGAAFLTAHARLHQAAEQREEVEKLTKVTSPAELERCSVSRKYLNRRQIWICSSSSFEALCSFLLERQHLHLLRLLIIYFSIHCTEFSPRAAPPAATQPNPPAAAPAPAAAAPATPATGTPAAAAPSAAAAPAAATPTTAAPAAATPTTAAPAAATPTTAAPAAATPTTAAPAAAAPTTAAPATAAPATAATATATSATAAPATATTAPTDAVAASVEAAVPAVSPAPPVVETQTPRQAAVSICVLGLHSDASRASITSFELSPCGRLCACGHADGAILLGRFSRSDLLLSRFAAPECSRPPVRKSRLIGHRGPVYSCAFSRESHYLLSGSQDGTVKLWSCRHNTCLVTYRDHGFPVWHVAFSPHNAQFLSCCHDGAVRIFCTERLSPLRVFPGHLSDVTAAHFHPNGGYVLSCSRDATLRFWAVADACCLRLLLGHTAAVLAVAVAPDGAHAASGSEDKTVRLWQLATGSCLRVLQTHAGPVGHVVFNVNGKLLASGGGKQVVVWDAKRALAPADNASPLVAVTSPLAVESAVFMQNQPVLLVCSQDLTMPL